MLFHYAFIDNAFRDLNTWSFNNRTTRLFDRTNLFMVISCFLEWNACKGMTQGMEFNIARAWTQWYSDIFLESEAHEQIGQETSGIVTDWRTFVHGTQFTKCPDAYRREHYGKRLGYSVLFGVVLVYWHSYVASLLLVRLLNVFSTTPIFGYFYRLTIFIFS